MKVARRAARTPGRLTGVRWKVLSEGQLNKANYAGRPTVCRNCGALVGAGEPSCSMCGAPKAAAAASPQAPPPPYPAPAHDQETMRFARAVLSRPYIFTIVFLVANIFVYFLTSQAGANENPAVLIRFGAKFNAFIDGQGEWWRFVTPIFLHGNVAHLLMNMYGLWVIGPYVERLYGSAKFVFFWVATGVAGVVASYLSVQPSLHASGPVGRFIFKPHDTISVGASGALFGLIGVLFVFGIKFRRELPDGFKRAFGTGMLPTILLNIVIGFIIPVIDNAAHLGGLLAGALLALVVGYKRPGERAGVAVVWHILQVAALALVAVGFVMVARTYNRPYDNGLADAIPPAASGAETVVFVNAINQGRNALVAAVNEGDAGRADAAAKALEKAPALDKRSGELLDELKKLLARAKEYAAMPAGGRAQQQQRARAQRALSEDSVAWVRKFDQWVRTEGANYNIYLPPPPRDAPREEK